MRDHDNPTPRSEMLRDCLGITAAATAFQAVKQNQGWGLGGSGQARPVIVLHPAARGCPGKLWLGRGGLPARQAVRKQPGPRPVEIQEIAVRRIDAFTYESNMVVTGRQRTVKGLQVAARQPGRRGAG